MELFSNYLNLHVCDHDNHIVTDGGRTETQTDNLRSISRGEKQVMFPEAYW